MTIIHHHPDISTLMSYAAGSLSDSMSLVISCHLEHCSDCRQRRASAESLGSSLVEECSPVSMSTGARDDILQMLNIQPHQSSAAPIPKPPKHGEVPSALQRLLGHAEFDQLEWKTLAPGMKQVALPSAEGKLKLLKIAPGTCLPSHGHSGTELTLVLKGSYTDECGRFQAGDLEDLDPDTKHQPVADTHEACICLIATDAPLKFEGLVPRLLQPFFGL
ncbi:transcriptional regulator [Endozoicomonas sp. OPT23]|uniref:ChrR family anti-sigma-E factor n=1 Tax=Endozoicomonas sp. OPT23 TaxID=2072845 RepID=UPI00129B55EB|nr:ChrR family anti-sigma-E factor [Endozoicomonas sp. OPT23]MRI31847.1 transcriptional regulator [Endozoicomonas sp. OPT23]